MTYLRGDVVTPLCSATSNLAINIGPLRAMSRVRLVLLLLMLLVMAVVFLVLLVDTVVHFLTEPTAATKQTSFTFLAIAPDTSRTSSLFELALLWRWVLTTHLSTACGIWKSLVSGCFVGVLLVVNKVPSLCKVCAEVLNNGTTQVERYIGPPHTRALCPVKLVLLPMINGGEV